MNKVECKKCDTEECLTDGLYCKKDIDKAVEEHSEELCNMFLNFIKDPEVSVDEKLGYSRAIDRIKERMNYEEKLQSYELGKEIGMGIATRWIINHINLECENCPVKNCFYDETRDCADQIVKELIKINNFGENK